MKEQEQGVESAAAFMELLKGRRSCRDYSERPVPQEMIDFCLEAARLSPSACNKQPWRFVIVTSPEKRAALVSGALLPGLPMPWLAKAPVIVALCAEKSVVTHTLAPFFSGVSYHLIDCGIAGEHFVLAAESQGLGTCWIGWFKPKAVRRILGIPRGVQVLSLISMGFPEKASEPRPRLPLSEIAFTDSWQGDRPAP